VLGFVNRRLSINASLGVICTLCVATSVVLLAPVAVQGWRARTLVDRESAGLDYMSRVWGAMTAADGALGDDTASLDAKFDSADAAQAFTRSAGLDMRLKSGAALLGAVASGSNLSLDSDPDHAPLVQLVGARLPAMMNAAMELAQAVKIRDGDQAVRLAVAQDHLQAASDLTQTALAQAAKRGDGDNPSSALSAVVQTMTSRAQTLQTGAAPDVIDGPQKALQREIDRVWRMTGSRLAQRLAARRDALNLSLGLGLAFAAAALLISTLLSLSVARGLSQRLRGLTKAAERLGGVDEVVIPHLSDGHDVGRLAAALEACRNRFAELNRQIRLSEEHQATTEADRRAEDAVVGDDRARQDAAADAVAEGLEKLARGDLSVRVEADVSAYQALVDNFNEAIGWLREVFEDISDNADHLSVDGHTLLKASDALAKDAEQQAVAMKQTASALDEIGASVSKAAGEARQIGETVAAARHEAERSGHVVDDAVLAMSEIEKSSQKISQIVGVIDEIAFQTNLLALNAGVEAARAGDAGRGFAVVAQEVRALAQRSAQAAREIKALIAASSAQVGSGVALVDQTGQTLRRIIGKVGEADALIGEITQSVQRQAVSVDQVNLTVSQFDRATQRNAANIEQNLAAARAVHAESIAVVDIIHQFSLGTSRRRQVAPGGSAETVSISRARSAVGRPVPALKTMGGRGQSTRRQPEPLDDAEDWEAF
jgi:methyl-accepting chemotaxis protein